MAYKALYIPADDDVPVFRMEISTPDEIRSALDVDTIERTQYDRDCFFYVDDNGRGSRPFNNRASDYILDDSEAAEQHGYAWPPDYGLYGDVVLIGAQGDQFADVPERFEEMYEPVDLISYARSLREHPSMEAAFQAHEQMTHGYDGPHLGY